MSPCRCSDKLQRAKSAYGKEEKKMSTDVNSLTSHKACPRALGSQGRRAGLESGKHTPHGEGYLKMCGWAPAGWLSFFQRKMGVRFRLGTQSDVSTGEKVPEKPSNPCSVIY